MSQTPPDPSPMESPSILVSTKAALGVTPEQHAFDSMIVTHINSVLSSLEQLGVGPAGGLMVMSEAQLWSDLIGTDLRLNMVKSYMYLRVRKLYDPPEIGFVLTAMNDEIKEMEWRLNVAAESDLTTVPDEALLDGGDP
jgi:hypothetical protein